MPKPKLIILTLLLLMNVLPVIAQVPWLHVSGNQIVDEQNNPVTLRGVSILAPEHNNECITCNAKPISEMLSWQMDAALGWNSRIVRLQVTTAKVSDPAKSFATIIDPYVQQAIAKGIYIIVDLHFVSNFDYNGSGGITQSQVMAFWNYVAPRYANVPNVIFEVFNEPISPDCWSCWKEFIQPVVTSIRSVAPKNLILMGSPQWSTRLNPALADPIAGNDIVYVYHIYPNQGQATAANLDPKFGTAAQTLPVMITEFGWNQDSNYSDAVTQGSTTGWGAPFRQYLDARPHISWTSYIFDNYWKPQFFDPSWNLMGTSNQGQFMQQWFLDLRHSNQARPASLSAFPANAGQINLTWPAVDGAQSYVVKRATTAGGPYTTIDSGITATTYSNIGLASNMRYYYRIAPVISEVEGTPGSEASAVTETPGFKPDVPMFTEATGSNAEVTVTWRSAPGALSYNVKRSTQSGGPYTTIATNVTTTTYSDTNVTNGTLYYYVVSAVGLKESANSGEAADIPSSVVIITDNNAAALTGTWTVSTGSPGFYGTDYLHDGNSGAVGGKSARYSPSIPAAGNYLVSVRWASASNRASNAPIEITHNNGVTQFEVNQRNNGGLWIPLGVFNFAGDTTGNVTIRNTNTNGFVVADAVKFASTTQAPTNSPPLAAFSFSANILSVAFNASSSSDIDGSITNYAWNFGDGSTGSGVQPTHVYGLPGSYTVTLTVTDDDNAMDSEQRIVAVTDGNGGVSTVTVNQQLNGGVMNVLGTYTFDAGTLGSVRIRTEATNGYVVADAVRFSRPGYSDIVLDNTSANGVLIEGAWSTSSATAGFVGTNYLHDANSAKGTKRVTYTPDLPAAGAWTVSAQWTTDPNRATNVPIDITHTGIIPQTTLYVSNIIEGSQSASQGRKYGTAKVFIQNNSGQAVANATVSGSFSGDFNETRSGITSTDGTITLVTTASKKGTLTFDFCVEQVTHATITYDDTQNLMTCSGGGAALLSQNTETRSVDLYPNPAESSFTIDLTSYDKRSVEIIVRNHLGLRVQQMRANESVHTISTADWRPGLYFVCVSDGEEIIVRQLFVK